MAPSIALPSTSKLTERKGRTQLIRLVAHLWLLGHGNSASTFCANSGRQAAKTAPILVVLANKNVPFSVVSSVSASRDKPTDWQKPSMALSGASLRGPRRSIIASCKRSASPAISIAIWRGLIAVRPASAVKPRAVSCLTNISCKSDIAFF